MLLRNFICRIRIQAKHSTPKPHLSHLLPYPSFQFTSNFSSKSSFTEDYLTNKCGLSPESALKASKHVNFESTTRPDSVLALLKTFNISKPHISKLILGWPKVLLTDPHRTLKPKFEFLTQIGISGPVLGQLVTNNGTFLFSSLKNHIIPLIKFFKNLVHSDEDVVRILTRLKWPFHRSNYNMGTNVAFLRELGVAESKISTFITRSPQVLCMKPDLFNKRVSELERMGVSHSDNMFIHCFYAFSAMKRPIWDAKMDVYKSFGWSEDEILFMFKRQPYCMAVSKEKISVSMNFLVNNLNWTLVDVSRNPTILMHSLEKRVIPRNYVLQILTSNGLIKKSRFGGALKLTEDMFVKKFVIKYQHQVPDLLKLYQSKMSNENQGLSIGPEDKCTIHEI